MHAQDTIVKLFNLARLKAKTKTITQLLLQLLFADDTALLAHSISDMQNTIDKFAEASKEMGLNVNITKTDVLYQPAPNVSVNELPIIQIDGIPLKVVKNFRYLGITISHDNHRGPQPHSKCMQSLWKTRETPPVPIRNQHLNQMQGLAVVVPGLLYSAETCSLYRNHIAKLNSVPMRHLRIPGINWQDHITNVEVLIRANMVSVEAPLAAHELRWAGHVTRLHRNRIPRILLYGEFVDGSRLRGGQKLRFKDVMKRRMKAAGIDVSK